MLKNFFKIMFSPSFRQVWMKRYEKYGVVRKFLILILMTLLTAGSIIFAIWSIGLYAENIVLGIVTSIIFIALGVVTFQISLVYSSLAFKMASWGTVTVYKKKVSDNQESEQAEQGDNEEGKSQSRHKWLDYLIGVLGIIYGIGVIVVLVLLIYNAIKK